jgi:hypothetical protein
MSEQSSQGTLPLNQMVGTFARSNDGSWHRVNPGLSVDPPSELQQSHQQTQHQQLNPYENFDIQFASDPTAYDHTLQLDNYYDSQDLNTHSSRDPALGAFDMSTFQNPYFQGYTEQGESLLETETYYKADKQALNKFRGKFDDRGVTLFETCMGELYTPERHDSFLRQAQKECQSGEIGTSFRWDNRYDISCSPCSGAQPGSRCESGKVVLRKQHIMKGKCDFCAKKWYQYKKNARRRK